MKCAVFHGPKDLRIGEKPNPEISDHEALLRVKACSMCGTDLKIYENGHPRITPPRILGHEIAGEVTNVGSSVQTLKTGDRVVLGPAIACGKCKWCALGLENMCINRFSFSYEIDGGYSEYLRIPTEALETGLILKIRDDVTFEEASLTEPLSCVVHGHSLLKLRAEEKVVIFGGGPIGTMHTMLSKAAGAYVIASEVSAARMSSLSKFGADIVINAATEDPVRRVLDLTSEEGVPAVIIATANQEVQAQALRLVAKKGRILFFAGLPQGKSNVSLDLNLLHYRELMLIGSYATTYAHFAEALELLQSRELPFKDLITRRLNLDRITDALEIVRNGSELKVTIAM